MSVDGPWSKTGYVIEVPYSRAFFRFQTLLQISFAALCNSVRAPDPVGVIVCLFAHVWDNLVD
jgi:hypothetical protein